MMEERKTTAEEARDNQEAILTTIRIALENLPPEVRKNQYYVMGRVLQAAGMEVIENVHLELRRKIYDTNFNLPPGAQWTIWREFQETLMRLLNACELAYPHWPLPDGVKIAGEYDYKAKPREESDVDTTDGGSSAYPTTSSNSDRPMRVRRKRS